MAIQLKIEEIMGGFEIVVDTTTKSFKNTNLWIQVICATKVSSCNNNQWVRIYNNDTLWLYIRVPE